METSCVYFVGVLVIVQATRRLLQAGSEQRWCDRGLKETGAKIKCFTGSKELGYCKNAHYNKNKQALELYFILNYSRLLE